MAALNLLFGLSIFLFGMAQLERAIELAGGDWLRRWLGHAASPLRSIASGVAATALVQSSSLVSLLVLAFAAAGAIPLFNAIGIMCGAALGTTTTGWLVGLLGFRLDLGASAIPLIGSGALAVVFGERRLSAAGWIAVSIGLLLFGLGLMKEAAETMPLLLDRDLTRGAALPFYFLTGALITALIQSSSATMLLTLAALHGQVIELPQAALIMAGANLGTTSTTLLAALRGAAVKKRLALASLLFHLFSSLLGVALLPLLIWLADNGLAGDPLFALAGFHSTFNLLGLLLFWPLLRPFADWLEQRFRAQEQARLAPWLSAAAARVPAAALTAAERALRLLLIKSVALNARNLRLSMPTHGAALNAAFRDSQSFEQRYEEIKRLEGELLRFVRLSQREALSEAEAEALMRLATGAREGVLAAKGLKDVRSNLAALRHESDTTLDGIAQTQRDYLQPAYGVFAGLLLEPHDRAYAEEQLTQLQRGNERLHEKVHDTLYHSDGGRLAEENAMLSTLLNVNRELWHATSNLIQALHHLYGSGDPPP